MVALASYPKLFMIILSKNAKRGGFPLFRKSKLTYPGQLPQVFQKGAPTFAPIKCRNV